MGEYSDFIGVNYYSRSTVSGLADGVRDGCPKNDLGWEIYPEGLVRCAEKLLKVLDRPIWVTENGTCDKSDAFRARYICEHLKAAVDSGLPFERYYHWCFCDNFEWLEGQSARFGIVRVDYDTQERNIKNSGRFYSEISAAGGVTEEIYRKYVAGEDYHY
jgi:beta-glucosidase